MNKIVRSKGGGSPLFKNRPRSNRINANWIISCFLLKLKNSMPVRKYFRNGRVRLFLGV